MFRAILFITMFIYGLTNAVANQLTLPEPIKPNARYVFYSHGYIVEGDNPKPIHKEWGVYDFPAVKAALKSEHYELIAYHRPNKTDPFLFAKKLANDVNTLISKGVKPENITLLGFSRGGALSILTSNELKNEKINTIILAGCAGLIKRNKAVQVYGHVRSIYETSDQVGSCNFLIERSEHVASFKEIAISTDLSHGAFYLPRPDWVNPVKGWIENPSY